MKMISCLAFVLKYLNGRKTLQEVDETKLAKY